jgi:ketosteroid isomerase-like protein
MKTKYPLFRIFILSLLTTPLLILTNCDNRINDRANFNIEAAESEIEMRLREYEKALENGNVIALGNMYTSDAEILHHGSPATKGREDIVKTFERMVLDSITNSGFTTTGLWGNQELLVEQGTGFFAHSAGQWKSSGKYLLIWKKVDGEWKIFRDTWFKDKN